MHSLPRLLARGIALALCLAAPFARALPDPSRAAPLGTFALKGIPEPQEVYRLL